MPLGVFQIPAEWIDPCRNLFHRFNGRPRHTLEIGVYLLLCVVVCEPVIRLGSGWGNGR